MAEKYADISSMSLEIEPVNEEVVKKEIDNPLLIEVSEPKIDPKKIDQEPAIEINPILNYNIDDQKMETDLLIDFDFCDNMIDPQTNIKNYNDKSKLAIDAKAKLNHRHKLSSMIISKLFQIFENHESLNRLADVWNVTVESFEENYLNIGYSKENAYGLENFVEHLKSMEADLKKEIKTEKIPLNKEEFRQVEKSLNKFVDKELLWRVDMKFVDIQSEENNKRPIILKEYLVNKNYQLAFVQVENPLAWEFENFQDVLVLTMDLLSGVILDKISYTLVSETKLLRKLIKGQMKTGQIKKRLNKLLSVRDYSKIINVIINATVNDDLSELERMSDLLADLFTHLMKEKNYCNIYIPFPRGNENELLRLIVNKLYEDSSNRQGFEQNFIEFPTKFHFILDEKQKATCLNIMEQICKGNSNPEEQEANKTVGGAWSFLKINTGRFKRFSSYTNICLEKAYHLGEKTAYVILPLDFQTRVSKNSSNKMYIPPVGGNIKKSPPIKTAPKQTKKVLVDVIEMKEMELEFDYPKFIFSDGIPAEQTQYYSINEYNDMVPYPIEICEVFEFYIRYGCNFYLWRNTFDMNFSILIYKVDLKNMTMTKYREFNNLKVPVISLNSSPSQVKLKRSPNERYSYLVEDFAEKIKFPAWNPSSAIISEVNNEMIKEEEIRLVPGILLSGLKEDVKSCKLIIDNIKSLNLVELNFNIVHASNMFQTSMDELANKNNLTYKIIKDQKLAPNGEKIQKNSILLRGNKNSINRLLDEIYSLSTIEVADTHFPKYWEPQKIDYMEYDVAPGTVEYNEAIDLFSKTVRANVIKLTRIQNIHLWKNYCFEKNKLKRKGNDSELLMFHGTRNNDPALIYKGKDDGFDMRLAASGSWGRGIYFSLTAAYSNNGYCHVNSKGNQILLIACVLIGNYHEGSQGNQITCPPLLPNSLSERYDSIKGKTGGSEIYIVYNNNKAYPYYIIEYKNEGNQIINNPSRRGMASFNTLLQMNNPNISGNQTESSNDESD